jgi:hypothetical protein
MWRSYPNLKIKTVLPWGMIPYVIERWCLLMIHDTSEVTAEVYASFAIIEIFSERLKIFE